MYAYLKRELHMINDLKPGLARNSIIFVAVDSSRIGNMSSVGEPASTMAASVTKFNLRDKSRLIARFFVGQLQYI